MLPASTRPLRVLAWPRWDNPTELHVLLNQYGAVLSDRSDTTLIIRADTTKEGSSTLIRQRLKKAIATAPHLSNLHILLLEGGQTEQNCVRLGHEITVQLVLPSFTMPARSAFAAQVNAPTLHSPAQLVHLLETWEQLKSPSNSPPARPPTRAPTVGHDSRMVLPTQTTCPSGWLASQLPAPPTSSTSRLAVIVPYRDRAEHLALFVPYMRQYLAHLPFDIFVVEQTDGKPFNRAKLLNAGFDQVSPRYAYCAFHDVDMLPVNADYSMSPDPMHLAARI